MSKTCFACIGMNHFGLTFRIVAAFCLLAVSGPAGWASDTNLPAGPTAHLEDTNSQEMLRAYLQLQEQLHATQLAIEQNRKEAKEAAIQNAEFLTGRLHDIEAVLAVQRARELEAMQSSNRVMLTVAGTFATFGFLVMLLVAYFQWRTVHGLAEMSTTLPRARALPPPDGPLVSIGPAEQSNVRLLGALERLEKRIYELEHTPHVPLEEGTAATSELPRQASPSTPVAESNGDSASHSRHAANPSNAARVEVLLGKGLSMLSQDKPEAALGCFDEALSLDPKNGEALVRRGIALERLEMPTEALDSYDRAIAADGALTIAYLHKGGLFNRMERFDEALACYEQALQTQERKST
jgi:tetratricopeptide (TPR) repeat protein